MPDACGVDSHSRWNGPTDEMRVIGSAVVLGDAAIAEILIIVDWVSKTDAVHPDCQSRDSALLVTRFLPRGYGGMDGLTCICIRRSNRVVGLARLWIFDAPFHTIPIDVDALLNMVDTPARDFEAERDGIQFITELLEAPDGKNSHSQ